MTDKFEKQPTFEGGDENIMDDPFEHADLNGESGTFAFKNSQLGQIVTLDKAHTNEKGQFHNAACVINDFGGIDNIVQGLLSNTATGISGTKKDIADRHRIYGRNYFPPPKIKSLSEILCDGFQDPINQILMIAAVVSIVIGVGKEGVPEGLIEGTSICIALCIILSVGSTNEYVASLRLSKMLASADETKVTVYRGSEEKFTIASDELVVGDLIEFKNGQKLAADLLFISGQDVKCKETDLTGEPDEFIKEYVDETNIDNGTSPVMFAKTECTSGIGKAIVISVGTSTASGSAAAKSAKASEENNETHLQKKLQNITLQIGKLGMGVAVLTALSQVVRILLEMFEVVPCGCSNIFTCEKKAVCEAYDFGEFGSKVYIELLNAVIISITVVVVAIPEGLPLAVTIALSFASAKMRELNNLVRKPASAETMGGATHICSDKTGTLTENKMTVMQVMVSEKICAAGANFTNQFVVDAKNSISERTCESDSLWDVLRQSIFYNSDAYLERDEKAKHGYKTAGNVTEQGIFKFFQEVIPGQEILAQQAELTNQNIELMRIPFTSSRKKASVVIHQPKYEGTDHEVRVYTKGGPDYIMHLVTNFLAANGEVQPIDETCTLPDGLEEFALQEGTEDNTHRAMIEKTWKLGSSQAYRNILCCYRDMSMEAYNTLKAENNDFAEDADRECLEMDLTAIALFGLQDPLRIGIIESIAGCRDAGIRTIMCTGDALDTATAISLNAGIIKKEELSANYSCMTGQQFRTEVEGLGTDEEGNHIVNNMGKFRQIIKNLRVMGRCSPDDKYLLVLGIQRTDGVVAVTGDGTNDAPALTRADVGFAMGITGTDVAKGASDIILMDDNFTSIVVALRFGRSVFDNVRKFLQFQLTVNVVAMFIVFFGAVILKDMPLNAVQMLWVNLIMDTFAALALATEPPEDDVLKRPPYHKDAAIVTDVMWRNVFGHSIYQIIVLIVIILAAQGPQGVVTYYEYQCIGDVKDAGCDDKKFNPFYTSELYYGLGDWPAPKKDATNEEFMQRYPIAENKLTEWRCNIYGKKYGLKEDQDAKMCSDVSDFNSKVGKLWPWTNQIEKEKPLNGVPTEKALHFTFVFQIFVFMQLFNQINGRKLGEKDFNVFAGVTRNLMFLVIATLTFIIQCLMVQFGGKVTKTQSLNMSQNLICLGIGAGELIWGVFIKFLPLKLFSCMSIKDAPLDDDRKAGVIESTIMRKRKKNKKADQ